jgi:VanZ family protein
MSAKKDDINKKIESIISSIIISPWSRVVRFWLPPLLWMAFIFPIGNRLGSSPLFYRLVESVIAWIDPEASLRTVEIVYIFFRKSFHFIEYGFLAVLFFRAFRQDRKDQWLKKWLIWSGSGAGLYACLDEFLQSLVPTRNGSLIDVLIDWLGIVFFLGIFFFRYSQKFSANSQVKKEIGDE